MLGLQEAGLAVPGSEDQSPSAPKPEKQVVSFAEALHCNVKAAVLMDGITGTILYEQDARLRIPPASFVKIMTLYIVYDAIANGEIRSDDEVTVSEKAWRMEGSKMFIGVGERVKVEELMKGIAIVSGNDACVAIAEYLAGAEEAFVSRMNEKAKSIGMNDTLFRNASGMPDPDQYTTAMDMAILSRSYITAYPQSLALHSTLEYRHNKIRQGNRNLLLYRNIGVDGLKTGHISAAGYHLVATAQRGDQRMISVIMGAERPRIRASEAQKLLEYGFRNFVTLRVLGAGDSFGPVKVSRSKVKDLMLKSAEDLILTVARGREKSVAVTPKLPESVNAPVKIGDKVGNIVVTQDETVIKEIPLYAAADIERSLLFSWQMIAGAACGIVLLFSAVFMLIKRPRRQKSGLMR